MLLTGFEGEVADETILCRFRNDYSSERRPQQSMDYTVEDCRESMIVKCQNPK